MATPPPLVAGNAAAADTCDTVGGVGVAAGQTGGDFLSLQGTVALPHRLLKAYWHAPRLFVALTLSLIRGGLSVEKTGLVVDFLGVSEEERGSAVERWFVVEDDVSTIAQEVDMVLAGEGEE